MDDPPTDPFRLLGVPATFDLDLERLQAAYLAAMARLHPDAGGGDGAGERAAAINRARAVLADPESRADALVGLLGGPSRERDRSLPAGFLEEMMGVRMRMEESLGAGEDPRSWREWAAGRREEFARAAGEGLALAASMQAGDPARAEALAGVRRSLNAWRYIERMIEQIAPGAG